MHVKPHVERLARLLHNRVVRRALHSHPTAGTLVLEGDLVNGAVVLRPTAVWDDEGRVLADGTTSEPAELTRWTALVDDLRVDFALLARVSPVALFVPYILDLRQLDLRLEWDEPPDGSAVLPLDDQH